VTRQEFRPVIGLEVHVQLATRTKLFCSDPVTFGAPPNTRVCPVCLGLPGALPVLNGRAVELAARAALGLDGTVHERSVFARKHYFYPDLPKGYQITQYHRPLSTGGGLDVPDAEGRARRVSIRRIHLEEDAGKSVHRHLTGRTAIDLNRAGIPLVEIVTEPELRSPAHARAFLTLLKRRLQYLRVSDCDMEKGSLRVDANVSVRAGGNEPGPKVELKNLNSFAQVERALLYELARQEEVVRTGGRVEPETRLWDPAAGVSRRLRTKEEGHDYRYFDDPDLPPLVLDTGWLERINSSLPERPDARADRFRTEYGLPVYDAHVLTATRGLADYYEAVARAAGDAKAASNWVMTAVLGWLNERGEPIENFPLPAPALAELIRLVSEGAVSSSRARAVFGRMAETGESPDAIVAAEGWSQVREAERLVLWIDEVLAAHPEETARLAAGEDRLLRYLVGAVMRVSGGRADPGRTSEMIRKRLVD
jgi:aspartyl-tRNA(Asn)/glutamyl-tRNA(Gln) amidotransferase subunit B